MRMHCSLSSPFVTGSEEQQCSGCSPDCRGEQAEQLCFQAAAALIPHPDKVEQGGEDAHFISDNGLALGALLTTMLHLLSWHGTY